MAAPQILLPPEILWNISKLSKSYLLSWTTAVEGNYITLSLKFDRQRPSSIIPKSLTEKDDVKLLTLPVIPRSRGHSINGLHPDLFEMDKVREYEDAASPSHKSRRACRAEAKLVGNDRSNAEASSGDIEKNKISGSPPSDIQTEPLSTTTVRKGEATIIPTRKQTFNDEERQLDSQVLTLEVDNTCTCSTDCDCVSVKAESNPQSVHEDTELSRDTLVPKQTLEQTIGAFLRDIRMCRDTDTHESRQNADIATKTTTKPQLSDTSQDDTATHESRQNADIATKTTTKPQLSDTSQDDTALIAAVERRLKERKAKAPCVEPERLVFLANAREMKKRRLDETAGGHPRKRLSTGLTGTQPVSEAAESGKGHPEDFRFSDSTGTRVKDYLKLITGSIDHTPPTRQNSKQYSYLLTDDDDDRFTISCYTSNGLFSALYRNINLHWLNLNSWKLPTYIIQQAALRLLRRMLSDRTQSDYVTRKEENLIISLLA